MRQTTAEGAAQQQPPWSVSALCRATVDALAQRFGRLVRVRGEISGLVRAASGHCYFSLKDADAQLRCALFRRAAQRVEFPLADGALVEVQARLEVYAPRGDLQLIVEDVRSAGQGALLEEFLRLKARLQALGLFDAARKRALPAMPRGIGLVTSPDAAALHDVASTLKRRAPHIPVLLAPALVQGERAAASVVAALHRLYRQAQMPRATPPVDAILVVRGGGSLQDLWAFNDEQLAHTLVQSPVPVISAIGHETDFTIADFCADLRAPTPTAAAELVSPARQDLIQKLEHMQQRLQDGSRRLLDARQQQLDLAARRLGQRSEHVLQRQLHLTQHAQRLRQALLLHTQGCQHRLQNLQAALARGVPGQMERQRTRLDQLETRLHLLDPQQVLHRGYALLLDEAQRPVTHIHQAAPGERLHARLADGTLDVQVLGTGGGDESAASKKIKA